MKTKSMCSAALALCMLFYCNVAMGQGGPCKFCYPVGGSAQCVDNVSTGGVICEAAGEQCRLETPCPGPEAGGGGCFAAGTLVETEFGPYPIELLEVGDRVLSLDEATGSLTQATITRTYKSVRYEYYVINGTLEVTSEHPFWMNGSWVNAEDIKVGDRILDWNNEKIPVESIERTVRGVRVYNIEVDGTHTFYVEGVLVHNKIDPPEE
jgi:hypothetical protein